MLEAQYLSMVAISFGSFICGLIPLRLSIKARENHSFFLSLLLCFGGGVLLATSLVHMLPEVKEKLEKNAELLFCAGFFLLYVVDELSHYCLSGKKLKYQPTIYHSESSRLSSSDEQLSIASDDFPITKYGTLTVKTHQPDSMDQRTKRSFSLGNENYYNDPTLLCSDPQDQLMFQNKGIHSPENVKIGCKKHFHHRIKKKSSLSKEVLCQPSTSKVHDCFHSNDIDNHEKFIPHHLSSNKNSNHFNAHQHLDLDHRSTHKTNSCHVDVGKPCTVSSSGVRGLLLALLIHSVLEGISIGVQTESSQVLLVLGAVACHKLVLSFCLGVELSSAGYESFSFVIAMILFSIGSPIGIAIGMSLTSESNIEYVAAPLQAIAGGSLMYIAAFEVLPRERFNWQHDTSRKAAGLGQLFFVLVGFAVITLLNSFVISEHDHFGAKPNSTVSPGPDQL